jgi:hypothetical protein
MIGCFAGERRAPSKQGMYAGRDIGKSETVHGMETSTAVPPPELDSRQSPLKPQVVMQAALDVRETNALSR